MAKKTPEKVEEKVEETVEETVEEPTKEGGTPAWVGRLEAKIEKLLDPPVTTAPEIIPTPPAPTPPAPMTPEQEQGPKKYGLKELLDRIW